VNPIGEFFIRAKAWKVFVIVVGSYLVGTAVFIKSIVDMHYSEASIMNSHYLTTIVYLTGFTIPFLWILTLGSAVNALVRPGFKLSLRLFRVAIAFSSTYLALLSLAVRNNRMLNAITPLSLIAMVCMFYALSFTARCLVLAEKGGPLQFYDYIGPFVLLWFFPFGIWIVQPRINRLWTEAGGPGLAGGRHV